MPTLVAMLIGAIVAVSFILMAEGFWAFHKEKRRSVGRRNRFVVHDDYSGSGRVTQLILDDVLVWSWAWHIDGPLPEEARELLRAMGVPDV